MEYLPLHWSILAFDVEGFSDSYRDDRARVAVRAGLHDVLHESFRAAGLPWSDEGYESRGDGAIVLVSPLVPKVLLIDPLFGCLCAVLADHNRNSRLAERFRLRCAVHAGEVSSDAYGMSGIDLILACRMLDSVELRASLLQSSAPVATIVSDSIYQAVVRHGYREIDPATYYPVSVRVKKNRINAWLHLPGATTPPVVTA
jgi:class 3 adenylate cyclase